MRISSLDRVKNRYVAVAGAILLALSVASPAQAEEEWHVGTSETSWVGDCNFNYSQNGIRADAWFQSDPVDLPRVGEVFYVRSVIARLSDGCGVDMGGHVEIVPPPGVTTAISKANPVRCTWMDIQTGAMTDAEGCPKEEYEGVYGPAFDQVTPNGQTETYPWLIEYGKALVIEVPLKSSRGLQGTTPGCVRMEGEPPCTNSNQSGDTLQFTVRMIDGWSSEWLSPYVPLFVHEGGSGGGAPANTKKPVVKRSGKKLVCKKGRWTNDPADYAYDWLVNGKPKDGAYARTLRVTKKLKGRKVRCQVTASNAAGVATALSKAYRV
ncbi:MAG: hypothetical protein GEU73_15540 [Chloroflexi bacterium]|nr:hypothetical protein [Chloroflexota bacterium]